jgi:5-methylcytosine-specific restriction endonuclease McrA
MSKWSQMTQRERNGRASASWKTLRKQILDESDECWLCGERGADTIDHVVPLKDGGTNERSNLRPAHGKRSARCPGNFGRSNRKARNATRTSRAW